MRNNNIKHNNKQRIYHTALVGGTVESMIVTLGNISTARICASAAVAIGPPSARTNAKDAGRLEKDIVIAFTKTNTHKHATSAKEHVVLE